jgi:hypothetical protein
MCEEGERQHTCQLGWLVDDIGRFLVGDAGSDDDVPDARATDDELAEQVQDAGRKAVGRGAAEVNELLRSAFAAHEVVATELRLTGRRRGARRTVFAVEPTPVALLLLCLRLCDTGDEVALVQHTAGKGSTTREARWPFGMAQAEELTRPPARDMALLPDLDA